MKFRLFFIIIYLLLFMLFKAKAAAVATPQFSPGSDWQNLKTFNTDQTWYKNTALIRLSVSDSDLDTRKMDPRFDSRLIAHLRKIRTDLVRKKLITNLQVSTEKLSTLKNKNKKYYVTGIYFDQKNRKVNFVQKIGIVSNKMYVFTFLDSAQKTSPKRELASFENHSDQFLEQLK